MCNTLDQDEVQVVEEDVFIHQGVYDVFAGNAAMDSVEQSVLIDRLLSDIRNDVETDMKMYVPNIGELGGKSDVDPLVFSEKNQLSKARLEMSSQTTNTQSSSQCYDDFGNVSDSDSFRGGLILVSGVKKEKNRGNIFFIAHTYNVYHSNRLVRAFSMMCTLCWCDYCNLSY